MKFEKGDIVRTHFGKVDWEVKGYSHGAVILESGMSGRRMMEWEHNLKPWTPDAR